MELGADVFWFFLGVVAAVFLTRLLSITHAAMLVNDAINGSLLMLSKIHEDVAFIRELKIKQMREAGMEQSQVRKFEKIDNQMIKNWKETVVQNMISSSPPSFKRIMKFNDWKGAMEYLNSIYKKY